MEEAYKMINDALKKLGLSLRMQDEVIMQIEDFVSDVNEQNVDHSGNEEGYGYDNDDSYCPVGGDYWRNDAGEYCCG